MVRSLGRLLHARLQLSSGLASSALRTMASLSRMLVFDSYGEPEDVLRLEEQPLPEVVEDNQVLVEFLASPLNPSDINTIQGKYPIKPALPGVPGHEGVGRVLRAGRGVRGLTSGDLVVPLEPKLGTWRSAAVLPDDALYRLPAGPGSRMTLAAAATLCVNPPTAVALLANYVALQPGDVVVQNGSTSAVGQAVIQLARAKGLRTINVIRQRPNWDETVRQLKALGADVVTTEKEIAAATAAAGLPPPRLALNCIGGSEALAVAKALVPGGTHVTYGAMALQPVSLPASLLIFKDITFKGFWLSGGWAAAAGAGGKARLMDEVVAHYEAGHLSPPLVRYYSLDEWRQALSAYRQDFRGFKPVLRPSPSPSGLGGGDAQQHAGGGDASTRAAGIAASDTLGDADELR